MGVTKVKIKQYEATARIVVAVSIPVAARDLAESAVAAQELRVEDFITVDGEHLDSSIQITGVSGPQHFDTEQP